MQRSFVFGVLVAAGLVFAAPADVESLTIAERLVGNSTTAWHALDHAWEIEDRL
jgi:hypothetical protein